jgi:hypothetical protein
VITNGMVEKWISYFKERLAASWGITHEVPFKKESGGVTTGANV